MLPLTRNRHRARFFGNAPTLAFDFISASALDSRITFTRASGATRFNSSGVLETVGNDVARLDFNPATLAAQGLLIEEQRTNLLLQSEAFNTTWTASNASVNANSTIAPTGTMVADTLVEDATTNVHAVIQNITFTAAAHTFSVFVKPSNRSFARLVIFDGTSAFAAYFDVAAGTVGTLSGVGVTASINFVGNGWYRCFMTATTSAGAGNVAIRVASANGTDNYPGDGTSGLFIWGAQLEAGAFPTSYIPTTTTAVTRAADVASVNTLTPWFNAAQGTLFAEYAVSGYASTGAFPTSATIWDGTGNNRFGINSTNTGANLYPYAEIASGGVQQAGFYGATAAAFGVGTVRRAALAYATNDFAFTAQSLSVQTDTSGTVPVVDRLGLGNGTGGVLNGHIRRIIYYSRAFAGAQLQALTA